MLMHPDVSLTTLQEKKLVQAVVVCFGDSVTDQRDVPHLDMMRYVHCEVKGTFFMDVNYLLAALSKTTSYIKGSNGKSKVMSSVLSYWKESFCFYQFEAPQWEFIKYKWEWKLAAIKLKWILLCSKMFLQLLLDPLVVMLFSLRLNINYNMWYILTLTGGLSVFINYFKSLK